MTSLDTTAESKDKFFEEIAALAERMIAEHGRGGFAAAWLRHKGLDWAANLLAPKRDHPQEAVSSSLETTP